MTAPRCTADTCTSPRRVVGEGYTSCWWCWQAVQGRRTATNTKTPTKGPNGLDVPITGQEDAS